MDKPSLFNREFQKEPSEKYPYKHIHTGEYCTFEAYVAEYILIRRSEKLNSGTLPYKFWTKGSKEHWTWLKQLNAARALAKEYGEKPLLSFLKSKDFDKFLLIGLQNGRGRGWKINPAIIPLLEKHKRIIEKESEREENSSIIEVPEGNSRRGTFGNNTKLNKLRGL
jgi:hypothetical protein